MEIDLARGTLLASPSTTCLMWSSQEWKSPKDAYEWSRAGWQYVNDQAAQKFIARYGADVIPQYPGENSRLSEWPVLASYTDERDRLAEARGFKRRA